ncbi:ketoacyl-ACP synthase III [bacterium]|nr:ketoacyl-ACP synthase III [bacterium]
MTARILGIDIHLPEREETNDDLARENPEWDMDRVCGKSGIVARRRAAEDETASDLGCQAAQKLLDRQLVDPAEIDFLLFCTESPDHTLPPAACALQHRLGLGRHVGAFDFNLGCSGYVYGLQLAQVFVEAGRARNVLLVTADTYTKYIHPRDRTVRTLFGDGAAATLVGPANDGPGAIGEFVIGTDGRGGKNLIVPASGLRMPRSPETAREQTDEADCVRSADNLYMNGPAIFSFAISVVPRTIKALLAKTGLTADDVDWFVYHQANQFMLDALAKRSHIPWEKVATAYERVGNTVSASIPIAIHQYVKSGAIQAGHRLMCIGFGVGYSWGACTVTWG